MASLCLIKKPFFIFKIGFCRFSGNKDIGGFTLQNR